MFKRVNGPKFDKALVRFGKVIAKTVKVTDKGVIWQLTSNEVGMKAYIRLTADQMEAIEAFVDHSDVVNIDAKGSIENIPVKYRCYTRRGDETESTYKYYKCKNASMQMITISGEMIFDIKASDDSLDYHHITCSFFGYDVKNQINKVAPIIKNMIGEHMMNDWD